MKLIYNFILLTAILIFLSIPVSGQEALLTAGGNASNAETSISYSVGQTFYLTHSAGTHFVSTGMQQPYEIMVHSVSLEELSVKLECKVYPNPSTEFLILKIDKEGETNLNYKLYSINGSLLKTEVINSNETLIEMHTLEPSNYFLNIYSGTSEIQSFKIIKQ